jgi:dipeptide/tripeptide permease
MFLTQNLDFDSNTANSIFHFVEFVLYFSAIFGAITADSYLGLFKTVSVLNLLQMIGCGMIAVVLTGSDQLAMR